MRFGLLAAAAVAMGVSAPVGAQIVTGTTDSAGRFEYTGNDFKGGIDIKVNDAAITTLDILYSFSGGRYTNAAKTTVDGLVSGTVTCPRIEPIGTCPGGLFGTFSGGSTRYSLHVDAFATSGLARYRPVFQIIGPDRDEFGFVVTGLSIVGQANIFPTEYSIAQLQRGVPEPATWALMILGFGAIGGAMRRRPSPNTQLAT